MPFLHPPRALRAAFLAAAALALAVTARPAAAAADAELTILSYHEVADLKEALTPEYAVTPTMFLRQMDWLRNRGYHFVSVSDVLAAREGRRPLPDNAVLVTFDDGYETVYTHAFPVLQLLHVPAVIAVVGAWLEEKGTVRYDGKRIPREKLLQWSQLKEMSDTGLIEIGSHSYDLHRGVLGNPQGNQEPAGITREYLPRERRYEDEASYRRRIEADLVRSVALLKRHTGKAPRVIAWPYGWYNADTRAIADRLGLRVGLTLDDGANLPETPLGGLRRILVASNMSLDDLDREITNRNRNLQDNDRPERVMHVDLDSIYDPNPAQQERNLSLLLDRIEAMAVNTVYLQAFADPDGNGSADAVYFPCRRLPMRADLFNRVAWQMRTRTGVRRVYAWMPVMAFELPEKDPTAADRVVSAVSQVTGRVDMGYRRLSPFSERARQAIREIYEDLAKSVPFDGILFHDDLTLSDYEDASPLALAAYRRWGLPGDVEAIRRSDDLLGRWTIFKINLLDEFALELAEVIRRQQPALKTARNLYARPALNPRAEVWYSQSLDNSLARYDFTAIETMPYMEQAEDHDAFYRDLVKAVADRGGLRKTVFELQAIDWRDGRSIPSEELAATIKKLYALGALHVGYYPDAPFRGHPAPAVLKQAFDGKGP